MTISLQAINEFVYKIKWQEKYVGDLILYLPNAWQIDFCIGWNIKELYREKGYATQAVNLLLRDKPKIYNAIINPRNEASINLALKTGFILHKSTPIKHIYRYSPSSKRK